MIKSNQGGLSLSLWKFKNTAPNEINTGFGNNTITNGVNTVVVISFHCDITPSFGLEFYGKEQVLFRVNEINGTDFWCRCCTWYWE